MRLAVSAKMKVRRLFSRASSTMASSITAATLNSGPIEPLGRTSLISSSMPRGNTSLRMFSTIELISTSIRARECCLR